VEPDSTRAFIIVIIINNTRLSDDLDVDVFANSKTIGTAVSRTDHWYNHDLILRRGIFFVGAYSSYGHMQLDLILYQFFFPR
jgi:hypothetical protein